jgi:hypothetical protein
VAIASGIHSRPVPTAKPSCVNSRMEVSGMGRKRIMGSPLKAEPGRPAGGFGLRAGATCPDRLRPGDGCATIVFRMRVTGGQIGQLYWMTEASPEFAEDRDAKFELQPRGEFDDYEVNVGDHPLWRGQRITALRIDPNTGAPGSEFEIDWIRCR